MIIIALLYLIVFAQCSIACRHIVQIVRPTQVAGSCGPVATGVVQPEITYTQELANDLKYPVDTKATISCDHAPGYSLLTEGSLANAPAHGCARTITCLASGVWSNSAIFSCKRGCYPLNTTTSEYITMSYTGTRSGLLYAPLSTLNINCQPLATRGVVRDLFAGTATTTVISGTADETLTCDQADGQWKNAAGIAQTNYECNNRCSGRTLPVANWQNGYRGFESTLVHGSTPSNNLNRNGGARTAPCDAGAGNDVVLRVTNLNGDGVHEQTIADDNQRFSVTCVNGEWWMTIIDPTATPNQQFGRLLVIECV